MHFIFPLLIDQLYYFRFRSVGIHQILKKYVIIEYTSEFLHLALSPPSPGMSSSLTSINPATLRSRDSADPLNDLVARMNKTKIVNGAGDKVERTHNEAPERYIKHPLQNAWTLWFFKNDKSRSWEENQRPIITVTTVEDFWSLYNHIEVASKLPIGADYSLFKEGIFPDWEDPRNQDGGRWIISLDKRHKQELLDTYWLEIIFFLIGEHADQHAFQVQLKIQNVL